MNLSFATFDRSSRGGPEVGGLPKWLYWLGPVDAAEERALIRRLWSLVSLLALYATALFTVSLVSDGPDVGCILVGIAGHVFYASGKTALAWREASFMEAARNRVQLRQRTA